MTVESTVLEALQNDGPLHYDTLSARVDADDETLGDVIDELQAERELRYVPGDGYSVETRGL